MTGAVAQVIGSFAGHGAERLAYNLGLALARAGERSLCIALREAGSFASQEEARAGGLVLEALGARPRDPRSTAAAVLRLRRLVREHEVEVVHCHGTRAIYACALALAGLGRRRPRLWFTWHNPIIWLPERGPRRRLLLALLRRCDGLMTPSAEMARRLEGDLGRGARVEVLVNGVPELAPSRGVAAQPPHVVWFARLAPVKDPFLLVRAAARLRDEGLALRVTMAGEDKGSAAEVRDLIARLGAGEVVRTAGWVDDIEAFMADAAIGVQTSRAEGLSMTLLEQLMAGLAVVATPVGDTPGAVRDGETGLLFPVGDEEALVAALRRLIRDPALRTRLGAAARADALARFSLAAMARQALALYRRGRA